MKTTKSLAFLLLTFLLFNCSKDETPTPQSDTKEEPKPDPKPDEPTEPEEEVYFSLNVAEDYIPENNEDWIIIHDENGSLVDYKQLENGGLFEFKASENEIPNKFIVTTLRYAFLPSNSTSRFFINTYPHVVKGSIWGFSFLPSIPKESNPTVSGKFSISVENITDYTDFTLSSLESISPVRSYFSQRGNNTLSIPEINIHQENAYFLTIVDGFNNVKYTTFDSALDGQIVSLDYNDFSFFENYLTIDLPSQEIEYTYFVSGLEEDVAYLGNDGFMYHQNLIKFENQLPFDQLKIGYLDTFDKHKIFFFIKMLEDGYNYQYVKNGNPTHTLVIPEKPDFNVQSESIFDFEFNASIDYVYSSHHWRTSPSTGNQTQWDIFSEFGSNTKINELPSEITTKYPSINLETLEYNSTSLNLKSESYLEFLERQFTPKESIGNTEFEQETLTLINQ